MKTFKLIALFVILTLIGTSMTSCAVRLSENHRDNGKHLGWFKNKKHHKHNTYVIENNYQHHPKARPKVKVTHKKNNHSNGKK